MGDLPFRSTYCKLYFPSNGMNCTAIPFELTSFRLTGLIRDLAKMPFKMSQEFPTLSLDIYPQRVMKCEEWGVKYLSTRVTLCCLLLANGKYAHLLYRRGEILKDSVTGYGAQLRRNPRRVKSLLFCFSPALYWIHRVSFCSFSFLFPPSPSALSSSNVPHFKS